ncbi:MAG: YceI family protein [Elusimicrobiales bacterium]|nr:YceI family protein [Elusimicrobiales bacterium]
MKKYLLGALLVPALLAQAAAATYKIDEAHSAVTFKVAHMAISKVSGRFDKFSGTIEYTPGDTKTWKTEAVIDAASINTGVEARDKHLRGPDFFDVEKFPTLTFKTVKVTGYKNMKGKLHGELTMHGVTKPVVLDVEGSGPVKDPWGNERMAAVAKTTINRKDFGLGWNQVLETGGLLVGEKIEITLEIEAVKEKPAPAK